MNLILIGFGCTTKYPLTPGPLPEYVERGKEGGAPFVGKSRETIDFIRVHLIFSCGKIELSPLEIPGIEYGYDRHSHHNSPGI
jgi:hypothetical protein